MATLYPPQPCLSAPSLELTAWAAWASGGRTQRKKTVGVEKVVCARDSASTVLSGRCWRQPIPLGLGYYENISGLERAGALGCFLDGGRRQHEELCDGGGYLAMLFGALQRACRCAINKNGGQRTAIHPKAVCHMHWV